MGMREHLKAIEIAARKMMPGQPCEEGACLACAEDRAVLSAIDAALAEAEKVDKELAERAKDLVFFGELRDSCLVEQEQRDADYQRAREAWDSHKRHNWTPLRGVWRQDWDALEAYFNPQPSPPEREQTNG